MIFDVIVLIAILVSSIVAFLRGFIRELLTIVGVVGGVIAAFFGGPFLLPQMHKWLDVPADKEKMTKLFDIVPMDIVSTICTYGLIFIVVVLVLSVLSYFLSSGAKALGLGPVDRVLGVVFGMARAALLLSLLYLPVYKLTTNKERDEWSVFKGSQTRFYVELGAEWIASFIPETTEKNIDQKSREVSQKLRERHEDIQAVERLKDAVDKAGDKAGEAMEKAHDKMESIGEPQPNAEKEGYKNDQRQKLDSLIQNNQ